MKNFKIRCRAPLRISFAGGGTDIKDYYHKYGGLVINATIANYAYTTLKPRSDDVVKIKQQEFDIDIETKLNSVKNNFKNDDFFAAIIKHFNPNQGFELTLSKDSEFGSGLGSSSTAIVSLVGAFNKWLNLEYDLYEIAETAYKIERDDLKIKGGKQDQYAATFGGFNFIEFNKDKIIVNSMKLKEDLIRELQFRILLVKTKGTRFSGRIIEDQIKRLSDDEILNHYAKMKDIAKEVKDAFYKGDLDNLGGLLYEEWRHKKALSPEISNENIEKVFKIGFDNGADGGKLLGAGGLGYIMLTVNESTRYGVKKAFEKNGYSTETVEFTPHGVEMWVVNNEK
jgi:D-glycero-alpha-D-manno-heptose-7-phosphate kinase